VNALPCALLRSSRTPSAARSCVIGTSEIRGHLLPHREYAEWACVWRCIPSTRIAVVPG
jgi:hypothetical protein